MYIITHIKKTKQNLSKQATKPKGQTVEHTSKKGTTMIDSSH